MREYIFRLCIHFNYIVSPLPGTKSLPNLIQDVYLT